VHDDSEELARGHLFSEAVLYGNDDAPNRLAAAQAWATLAVAEAIEKLADAVNAQR
jgi:hypothetical protein